MIPSRVALVVLAAGSSSRLGHPKQLIEFEGQTLIRRTVQTALASDAEIVVVTTAENGVDFDRELDGLQWHRSIVQSPQLGQSESIRASLRTVEACGGYEAILFTPCDLPLLSSAHLNALINRFKSGQHNIVASRYGGALGAPLVISRELWPELHLLQGDVGVRKILPAHLQTIASLDWEAGRFDVDTPDDVKRLADKL